MYYILSLLVQFSDHVNQNMESCFLSLYTASMAVDFLKQDCEGAMHTTFHVCSLLCHPLNVPELFHLPIYEIILNNKIPIFMIITLAHAFVSSCNMKSHQN
jgi:hypothetical protein